MSKVLHAIARLSKHFADAANHHAVSNPGYAEMCQKTAADLLEIHDSVPEQIPGSTVETGTEFHGAADADLLKSFTD